MGIIKNWHAPTPPKFKKLIQISLIAAAGAGALLTVESVGKTMIPGFTFTLFPLTVLICKNVFVGGIIAAVIAKAQKETAKLDEVDENVKIVNDKVDTVDAKVDEIKSKVENITKP